MKLKGPKELNKVPISKKWNLSKLMLLWCLAERSDGTCVGVGSGRFSRVDSRQQAMMMAGTLCLPMHRDHHHQSNSTQSVRAHYGLNKFHYAPKTKHFRWGCEDDILRKITLQ